MLEYGFDVYPISDGEIHRFKGPEDKKPNGWYVFHGDHGAFGNWKSNLTVPWSDCTKRNIEPAEYQKLIERERADRARKDSLKHSEAAIRARSIWTNATPAIDHPYLTRKQVQAHGIRQSGEALIIPMYRGRELRSIQRIFPSGQKLFLEGGATSAAYYPIGHINGRLWIAEGFATSGSIHEATGDAVACAFSGFNMAKVAKSFHKQYPDLDIRIAGDAGGEPFANEAMIACLGKSALPVFDDGDDGSDWNDFLCLYGKDKTREALYGRI